MRVSEREVRAREEKSKVLSSSEQDGNTRSKLSLFGSAEKWSYISVSDTDLQSLDKRLRQRYTVITFRNCGKVD